MRRDPGRITLRRKTDNDADENQNQNINLCKSILKKTKHLPFALKGPRRMKTVSFFSEPQHEVAENFRNIHENGSDTTPAYEEYGSIVDDMQDVQTNSPVTEAIAHVACSRPVPALIPIRKATNTAQFILEHLQQQEKMIDLTNLASDQQTVTMKFDGNGESFGRLFYDYSSDDDD